MHSRHTNLEVNRSFLSDGQTGRRANPQTLRGAPKNSTRLTFSNQYKLVQCLPTVRLFYCLCFRQSRQAGGIMTILYSHHSFFHIKRHGNILTGRGPPNSGVEYKGMTNRDIRPVSRFVSETIQHRDVGTME